MSKALRLSEKWFRFGLWVVAIVFASFLIGLGSSVVRNLPKVEHYPTLEDFIDKAMASKARAEIKAGLAAQQVAKDDLDQAQLRLDVARANATSARETFNNWLATRQVTKRAEQDSELIERTRNLDELKSAERRALHEVEQQRQLMLDARQAEALARRQLHDAETQAQESLRTAQQALELRVFAYRLALTLPLLGVAGWLFTKKRQSSWWPFVWGFIFFALFAFFVELVPYLPSYGGYVRSLVGIVATVLVGRYVIIALNRYREKQIQAEALPDSERRKELSYDSALARLGNKVCPGCERAVNLGDVAIDYCPHCGICLFDRCSNCKERKSAFARFCHACGTAASTGC